VRCELMDRKVYSTEEKILSPLIHTGREFYFFLGALLALLGWSLYAWYTQLTQGLAVTGMRDIGVGPPWGLYISNFIFFIGLAHGGIAISAAVRIAGLKTYKPITRMAELLTPISILMAALSIVFDLGRPDRIMNLFLYYFERAGQSPLSWDLAVIIIYFAFGAIYLFLTMRSDLAVLSKRRSRLGWLYKLLVLGYVSEEKEKVERLAWWMALCIPALLVLLSGGVIAWLIGLMIGRPGWYGAFMGPYFVTAAVISAIAAVIVVAAVLRHLFKWEDLIGPEIFKGLASFLATSVFVYLYFVFAEQITVRYSGPSLTPDLSVSQAVLVGEFAWIFWPMLILLFIVPGLALFIQIALRRFSLGVTTVAALAILTGLWVKRVLIVVPPLTRSLLPYPLGTYTPTWVEWSLIASCFVMTTLLYALFIKLFPLMEVRRD